MKSIVLENIDKFFPSSGTWANRKASLRLSAGEIHAVVGENGAGKTTLVRILAGLEKPDSGSLLIDALPVSFKSPAEAMKRGIGMVHQHFLTIPGFSAGENIVFGAEPRAGGFFVGRRGSERAAAAAMRRFGFSIDPAKAAESLTVGERQQVEILKLLYRDCEVLILDEPTSVLTEQEIQSLFSILRRLREEGRTIVIITHKVKEVKEIADVVSVMREGATVGSFKTSEVSEFALSAAMMGQTAFKEHRPRARALPGLEPVLELEAVSLRSGHRGAARLENISLALGAGEICGVCAISGNGLLELEDLLAGMLKPSSGTLRFLGAPYPKLRSAPWKSRGISYVPSDRMRRGSCAGKTVAENFIALDRSTFFPKGILDAEAAKTASADAILEFSIKAKPWSFVDELSGGSVQKMILARELSDPPPRLCVLCEPTWGLDAASTEFAYDRILALREKGSAILLLSSDLDEIITLAERIIVLHGGRVVGAMANDRNVTREGLGALMLGLGAARATARAIGGSND
ncbi:MAG: ABC transporter ATP-binding protein [Spirochaetales bacterium]